MTKFVALDVETTGLDPQTQRIVEIALVEVTDYVNAREAASVQLNVYRTLLNPEKTIGKSATKVHGITNADVADAPVFADITDDILDTLAGDDVVVIGHNVSFDIKFLRAEFNRAGVHLPMLETECTMWLARRVLPQAENHKLGTLAAIFDLTGTGGNEHSAAHDAVLSAQLFHTLTRLEEMEREEKPRQKAARVATKPIDVPVVDVPVVEATAPTRTLFQKALRFVAITAVAMIAWTIAIVVATLVTPAGSTGLLLALFAAISAVTLVGWWIVLKK